MVKTTTVQAAHTYGVLDPTMADRRDTKFVPGSLSDGQNIIVMPQGGYTDRGGTDDYGRVRRSLIGFALDASMLSLPNGGSVATLLAGQPVTTTSAAGGRFVLVNLQFAAPTSLVFIDLVGVYLADTGTAATAGDGALVAEWFDGANWQPFGKPLRAERKTYQGTRRFAAGPPGNPGHTASAFRVCLDATKAAGAVAFSGFEVFGETTHALGECRVRLARDLSGRSYQMILTGNNIDVFTDGQWQAAIRQPLGAASVPRIQIEASYDSVLLFHEDMAPQKATRLGATDEWTVWPAPFVNIPEVDYGGVYGNGVNEQQSVILYDIALGETFDLAFEGETTTAITKGDQPTTAAGIKAALEALPNVGAGIVVTSINSQHWLVEFASEKTKERNLLPMIGTELNLGGYVRILETVKGRVPGEPIMSAARGWPAVGRFAMGRLNMFGLKSRPASQLSTSAGEAFDLTSDIDVATAALVYDIADSEGARIVDALFSRVLVMFASETLYFYGNRTLDADKTPDIQRSSAPGIQPGVPPVMTDNAIFYVEKGGSTLRVLSYSEIDQNYSGDNASVLSASLFRGVVDMTRRRASRGIDGEMLVAVNDDGTAVAMTTLKSWDISGFAPWRTDGQFLSAVTDHDNEMWFLVRRGGADARLERFAPEKLLDQGIERDVAAGTWTLSDLEAYEGRAVWTIASGEILGPNTVLGGSIALDRSVEGQIRIGTWIPVLAVDHPVQLEAETGRRMPRLKRVARATLSLLETTSVAIACNGAAPVALSLWANDEIILDQAPLDRTFTGRATAEGMHGYTPDGTLTVTQLRPGFLTVRSVTKDVAA